jgi:hypothetical protein
VSTEFTVFADPSIKFLKLNYTLLNKLIPKKQILFEKFENVFVAIRSSDLLEHQFLKDLVHNYVVCNPSSLESVLLKLRLSIDESETRQNPMMICPVIDIYSILFMDLETDLDREKVLCDSILPLIGNRFFLTFQHQMTSFIQNVLDMNLSWSKHVLNACNKYWSKTESSKQIWILLTVFFAITKENHSFDVFLEALKSTNENVVLTSIGCLKKKSLLRSLALDKTMLLSVVDATLKAMQHWSPEVKDQAKMLLNKLRTINYYLVQQIKFSISRAVKRSGYEWELIYDLAPNNHEFIFFKDEFQKLQKGEYSPILSSKFISRCLFE